VLARLVLRGSVRLIAVVATRIQTFTVEEFAAISSENWQNVRLNCSNIILSDCSSVADDPDGYLAELETKYLQLYHPSFYLQRLWFESLYFW